MAKPDCDDGWMKLARELFAALWLAPWTDGEKIVLLEVFEQIYGPAKPRRARFSVSALARAVGATRSHVSDALSSLLKRGVLSGNAHSGYAFVKDYERWRRGGEGALSAVRMAHAKHAPARAKKRRADDPKQAAQSDTIGCHPLTPDSGALTPSGGAHRHHPVARTDTIRCHPHIDARARQRDLESKRECNSRRRRRSLERAHDDDDDSNLTPEELDALGPEWAEVCRLAERLIRGRGAGRYFSTHQSWHACWVKRALESAARWDDPPSTVKPIVELLNQWTKAGAWPGEKWVDWREKKAKRRARGLA